MKLSLLASVIALMAGFSQVSAKPPKAMANPLHPDTQQANRFATEEIAVTDTELDTQLRDLINLHQLSGDPTSEHTLPLPTDEEVTLGKLLFFTKALSGDKDVACVTCHHPFLGGGDGLALSIGVGATSSDVLGPGRQTQPFSLPVARNAPTIFNAALWEQSLFWDSRVETVGTAPGALLIRTPDSLFGEADPLAGSSLLQAQARFPVTSVEEMRGESFEAGADNNAVRDHLAARLGDYGIGANELIPNHWRPLFEAVFNDQAARGEEVITFDNIAHAIGQYEASFNLTNNPWFAYIKGDTAALNTSEKRGALLFYNQTADGGAGCVNCHSGDFFTNGAQFNIGFPQIGPGTGDGETQDEDFGRERESGVEAQRYAFRTATLLNVGVTAPYSHAGAYNTLEEVIDHYNDIDNALPAYFERKGWCSQPQFKSQANCANLFPNAEANTNKALDKIIQLRELGIPAMLPLGLSDQDKSDLVAFLHTLTDPCTRDPRCMSQWLPKPHEGDPDKLQLKALDARGNPLSIPRPPR